MSVLKIKRSITNANVFPVQQEGMSETIALSFTEEIDGFKINTETGVKEPAKIKRISVFVGDVIKALANGNDITAQFLAAKSREERLKFLPVILAGAKVEFDRELKDREVETEDEKGKTVKTTVQDWITTITKITLSEASIARMDRALDSLFGNF